MLLSANLVGQCLKNSNFVRLTLIVCYWFCFEFYQYKKTLIDVTFEENSFILIEKE